LGHNWGEDEVEQFCSRSHDAVIRVYDAAGELEVLGCLDAFNRSLGIRPPPPSRPEIILGGLRYG
jgi:hypothetical protein